VRVVTATSTCLGPEQARELGIGLVPLHLTIDGRDVRDMLDISPSEVYRLLRRRVPLRTSSPSPGDFVEAFEAAPGPILCLTDSARFSASHGAARVAAQLVLDRTVEVPDTGTAATGVRLLALAAARLAAQGMELGELTARITGLCPRVEVVGMLDSVEYLRQSGRVPELYLGSSLLRVHPIVRFRNGKFGLAALVRKPQKGLRELEGLIRRDAAKQGVGPDGERLRCAVFHADAAPLGEELLGMLRQAMPAADLSLSECTPAMGVHTGPGLVGYAQYVEPV
jgi:DegV family protein with EDD domain